MNVGQKRMLTYLVVAVLLLSCFGIAHGVQQALTGVCSALRGAGRSRAAAASPRRRHCATAAQKRRRDWAYCSGNGECSKGVAELVTCGG